VLISLVRHPNRYFTGF